MFFHDRLGLQRESFETRRSEHILIFKTLISFERVSNSLHEAFIHVRTKWKFSDRF